MNKAQHLVLLLAFWLALTDMVRTQQEDVRRKDDGFVQFNEEDNFLRQDGSKGQQQQAVKLKQILQQMLRSGIGQPGKRADEDYSQEYEDDDNDYDNGAEAEPDVGTEIDPVNDADDDPDYETDNDSGNETDNDSNSGGDPGSDSNSGSNNGSDSGIESETGSSPGPDSNSGSNTGSGTGADTDAGTFDDDDFEYDPYSNSFNDQLPDGTYVFGYALPHGVRRYERAFYSDKYKGLVVEGFSTEPRQMGQRMVYELRCFRSDAYSGYRPLKVQYLNRPPTVQRDVEPNVDCFN